MEIFDNKSAEALNGVGKGPRLRRLMTSLHSRARGWGLIRMKSRNWCCAAGDGVL